MNHPSSAADSKKKKNVIGIQKRAIYCAAVIDDDERWQACFMAKHDGKREAKPSGQGGKVNLINRTNE